MPIKNVRMSGHISELESNFKKDRYSLKKFLDRSRFSPRLLRFTRLSKSIECDTTKPGNTNSEFEPASNHISKTTAYLCSGGSRETNVPSTTSSTHATVPSLCPVSNYTPILGHGIEANQTHELVVEEEYEESLSHFADVIIENLRTGNNFITNRSPDGISEVSDGRSSSYSTLPTTRLTTWGYPGHSPNCEPAKAACINSQRIPFTSFEQINHCAIYNEPCDAKPLLDGVVDGPPMIYTMSSLARELNEISANLESSPRSCTKSSPYSSTSNTTGHETRSLQSSVLEDRALSVGNTSLRLVSPRESPKSIDGVSKLTRVTDGAVSVASHLVSVDPQSNHVFVDSPRGNSVIVHHPTSPFARVPRAPADITLLNQDISCSSHTESVRDSTTSLTREGIHYPPTVESNLTNGVPNTANDSPMNNNGGSANTPSKQLSKASQHRPDTQATYEEAWDLKMARQLGFGIPRLTATPHTLAKNKVSSGRVTEQTPTRLPHDMMPGQVTPRVTPVNTQPIAGQAISEKSDVSLNDSIHTLSNSNHTDGVAKSNLLSHENRLFDERPLQMCTAGSNQPRLPAPPTSEYDYAYNGSWCMGVKLNLSLAMNNVPKSEPIPPFSGAIHSVNTHFRLAPPAVPAHQHDLPRTGIKSHLVNQQALSSPVEFDIVSTGSFDDSWDKKHGQVISELTTSRFMNATPALSAPTPPSDQPNSSHIHRFDTYVDQVGTGNVPNVVSETKCSSRTSVLPSCLEVLPLEEQLWYHPSLTRSEAEALLSCEPEGSFLVRNSETCVNDYSLTIKHKTFLHMKISRNQSGQFILGEYSQPYASVPQMIYHYSRTLVPVRGADCVTLTHPICRRVV